VGVAAEVLEEARRAAERPLDVDDPGRGVEGGERAAHGRGDRHLAPLAGPPEGGEQRAAKERGQDADGKQVALAGGDPAAPVRGQATGRDDAVHMRMELEGAGPRVPHGGDAELRAEPLRIAPQHEEGLECGPQQERKHLPALGAGFGPS
jgi:hypothetical protein